MRVFCSYVIKNITTISRVHYNDCNSSIPHLMVCQIIISFSSPLFSVRSLQSTIPQQLQTLRHTLCSQDNCFSSFSSSFLLLGISPIIVLFYNTKPPIARGCVLFCDFFYSSRSFFNLLYRCWSDCPLIV